MIPSREIKERARAFGVPVSTVERDYAQNWILRNLGVLDLVLKGGTGIRKVYIENYRFSDDLDFTMTQNIEKETLINSVKEAVVRARDESGMRYSDEITLEESDTGFWAPIYFSSMVRSGGTPIKIKIDITSSNSEKILLPTESRKIIHLYSDKFEAEVKSYCLEEIVAEKMRSLFERTRPRDIYDVWFLSDKVDKRKVQKILPEKFKLKEIVMEVSLLEERKEAFAGAWQNSLQHQLKELPDFARVYEAVISEVAYYKSF